MRLTVVGSGYVGSVTGACLADMGNEVVCYDHDAERVARLAGGELPFFEPGLAELVRRSLAAGRLHFCADLGEALTAAELCFIAVGTPAHADGSGDRRQVFAVVDELAARLDHALVLVVKSTVPVGTGDELAASLQARLAARGATFSIAVASNPEFLKEGKAVEDFMRPDRIVIGADDGAALATLRRLYEPFVRNGHPLLCMDRRSAEMTKYAANVMLAARVSLVNELAGLCEKLGADIVEVRRGIGSDARLGSSYLYPGVGFGGSCLPKDVAALATVARELGCNAEMLTAIAETNRRQVHAFAQRILERFGGTGLGKRVGVWGLAFKPQTDDVRDAPALAIIARLVAAGFAVRAFDPAASATARRALGALPVELVDTPYAAAAEADALVLVTEWGVFRSLDFARVRALMRAPLFFDGRNQYSRQRMRELGFEYHCIGRPT